MKTFFFEILSEEIPARMQKMALHHLRILLSKELDQEKLLFTSIETYITPRRLVGVVRGLPEKQPDQETEIRGPRVDASSQAIEGFLKSQGLVSLDVCHKLETQKGNFWAYLSKKKGKRTQDLLGPLLARIIEAFPWPKSMEWGGNDVKWIRPLRGVLSLFEEKIVSVSIGTGPWKIISSNTTIGHRFLSPHSFEVSSFESYLEGLKHRYVVVDEVERQKIVKEKSQEEAEKWGLDVIEDVDLLEEVVGLVEWPVPLLGRIPQEYMSLPAEVLRTSMRVHQRYFSLTKGGKLAPFFLVVANQFSPDNGIKIVEGNEKVLKARLSDALFFWEQDLKTPLEKHLETLKERVFQDKLGTLFDKATRLQELCEDKIGKSVLGDHYERNDDLKLCGRAGLLAKADLATQMVREFPELQGVMGSYYAHEQGEHLAVVEALRSQYLIKGCDEGAYGLFSIVLGLADRIDTLYGFFGIEVFPTGSKDPYALRRAALGILRILRENNLEISLNLLIEAAFNAYRKQKNIHHFKDFPQTQEKLLTFFEERLKIGFKEEGLESDIVSACLQSGWEKNIPKTCNKIKALESFLKTHDGMDLLAAFRRANNIIKGSVLPSGAIDESLFKEKEEHHLWETFKTIQGKIEGKEAHFESSFRALSELRMSLDSFFNEVVVNVADEEVRINRCILLSCIVTLFKTIADFSKIEKEG